MPDQVAARLQEIRDRVSAAAARSGRSGDDVRLVGVVKGIDDARIGSAVAAGLHDLGENYAKELDAKAQRFADARWHFLGAIQTNKVKQLGEAQLLHSLHREKEAEALTRSSARTWDVLIEVNVAGEQAKQGIAADQVEALLDRLAGYPSVKPRGFMFVAPEAENPEDVRWVFAEGRRLRERFSRFGLQELSMGMSDDFEVAVEEGATIVRIGRAIFGPRMQRAKS